MKRKAKILIVEDDETLRQALVDTIIYGGFDAISASNGVEALDILHKENVNLVISDVQMDEMDGHTLLRKIRQLYTDVPVVLMTAHGSVEKAVEAMQEGASDYLVKPFQAQVLLEMVSRFASENVGEALDVVAADGVMKHVYALAHRVADTAATVMISGESGTGKEVMARYIHERSQRRDGPFIAINCAAIPEPMLESMLFGYEKGAYTGAHQTRAGKFEQANGGTILLDEISEMDIGLQAKLLRVLQEKEVERLGGNKLVQLDVRVLATTNRELRAEVAAGRFREDLYYRLNVFPMQIPALRERPGDVLSIAEKLITRHGANRCLTLSDEAKAKLLQYEWPGNVRELDNCIQRATILASGKDICAEHIYFEDALSSERLVTPENAQSLAATKLDGGLRSAEKQMIVNALETVGGRRKDAAKMLGISPRTLRYKLARLKEQGVAIPATA